VPRYRTGHRFRVVMAALGWRPGDERRLTLHLGVPGSQSLASPIGGVLRPVIGVVSRDAFGGSRALFGLIGAVLFGLGFPGRICGDLPAVVGVEIGLRASLAYLVIDWAGRMPLFDRFVGEMVAGAREGGVLGGRESFARRDVERSSDSIRAKPKTPSCSRDPGCGRITYVR